VKHSVDGTETAWTQITDGVFIPITFSEQKLVAVSQNLLAQTPVKGLIHRARHPVFRPIIRVPGIARKCRALRSRG
jgi:hypothetical protein